MSVKGKFDRNRNLNPEYRIRKGKKKEQYLKRNSELCRGRIEKEITFPKLLLIRRLLSNRLESISHIVDTRLYLLPKLVNEQSSISLNEKRNK